MAADSPSQQDGEEQDAVKIGKDGFAHYGRVVVSPADNHGRQRSDEHRLFVNFGDSATTTCSFFTCRWMDDFAGLIIVLNRVAVPASFRSEFSQLRYCLTLKPRKSKPGRPILLLGAYG